MALSYNQVFGQGQPGVEKYTLSGKVVDAEGSPLPYASVAVFKGLDSVLVAGDISNDAGEFSIVLERGSYFTRLTLLSYAPLWVNEVDLEDADVALGNLIMEVKATELNTVEITGDKNQMVLKLDKRIFNVGADLTNAGRNASEILDNIPSVSVDIDGNVALRGSQNVRILIDGKPSGLTGTDALRALQGNMVDKVEVITNPSARYDAEGEVGIINIVLKKEKQKGVNGSFELSAGIPHNHQAAFNLNMRKKWVNLFTNYSLSYRKTPGNGNGFTQFDFPDTSYSFTRTREHVRGGLGHTVNLGTDFFLPAKQTLTISGIYKNTDGDNLATVTYRDFNEAGLETGTSAREDDEEEKRELIEASLSYLKEFSQKDRKWTIDMKVMQSDDLENSIITQTFSDGSLPLFQRVSNTENERQYFLQSDYVQPFWENGRLETGVRATLRRIENDFGVDEQSSDGSWFPLAGFNNNFVYTENIYAGYIMAGNQTGKFSYQAGLRAEYSEIITELTETNEINPRDYLNLFPSAHLSYKLNKQNDLQLSYSRRLNRPGFRELLPFFGYSDNRVFYSGNPNLNPEYTHSFEAGHLKYFSKGSILSSVYYRYQTGVISRITQVDTTGFTTIFPVNLAVQNSYGLEFNVSYAPVKKWKLNGNFNFYRALTEGEFEGQSFEADALTMRARITSKVSVWKDLDIQLNGDYRAPQNSPQGRVLAMWRADLGMSKDVIKKKATLTLSLRDIFNSRRRRWETFGESFFSTNDFQWRSRQLQLTFTYRLNQDKKRGGQRGGNGGDAGGDGF